MTSLRLVLLLAMITDGHATSSAPKRDLKYDTKHERNVLDFWPGLKPDTPAPVFVWFHGGGFRNGDKNQIEKYGLATLKAYRKAGYAVISCNYPFLGKDMEYRDIVDHCGRAVKFIRSQAKEWHIDPNRLCCGGVSAGALISQFLGYHDDLADPKAKDPIDKLSSRPAVVVGIMQPIGTQEFALRYMDKGEAPLFLYSNAKPSDRVHPPKQLELIRDKAKSLGIPVEAYGGQDNKLPQVNGDKTWLDLQVEFCTKHLKN
ncbi:MAG: acetyl esterase/lipase [Akkermansiaceae bacterium]|jgi:acetyl esterase/lipase